MNINFIGMNLTALLPAQQDLNPKTVHAVAGLTHDRRASAWRSQLPQDYWSGKTEAHPLWWAHESGEKIAVPVKGVHERVHACVILTTAEVCSQEDVTIDVSHLREFLTDPGEEPQILSEVDPTFKRWTVQTQGTSPEFGAFLGIAEGGNTFTQAMAEQYDVVDSGMSLMYSPRGLLGYRLGEAAPAYIGDGFRTWLPGTEPSKRLLLWRSVDSQPIIEPMMGRNARTLAPEQPGT